MCVFIRFSLRKSRKRSLGGDQVLPAQETAELLAPEAAPERSSETLRKAVAVNGATHIDSPKPNTMSPERNRASSRLVV